MPSIIKECTCEHEYQDKAHGKNQRVFNLSGNKAHATCTVCGKRIQLDNPKLAEA